MGKRIYSKEECVSSLILASKSLGNFSRSQYNICAKKNNKPLSTHITSYFGLWSAAKREAGLLPLKNISVKYSDRDILNALIEASHSIGDAYTDEQYTMWQSEHPEHPPIATIRLRNGERPLSEIKQELGLRYLGQGQIQYASGEWRDYLARFISSQLSYDAYVSWSRKNQAPDITTIAKRASSFNNGLFEVLKDIVKNHNFILTHYSYSEDELVEYLVTASKFHGGTLTFKQYDKFQKKHPDFPHIQTIIARFKRWNLALKAAGIPINLRVSQVKIPDGYFTIDQVGEKVGLTINQIRSRIRKGTFPKPTRRILNKGLWTQEQIDAFEEKERR